MSRRILIIDAIATRRIVMKVKLGAAQYDVFLAEDLAEAETYIAAHSFDIIFVDDALPGGAETANGLCAALKAAPATQSIPVIMMSDDAPEDGILTAFQTGFDDVILRPLSERVLLAQLRAMMRRDASQIANRDTGILSEIPGPQTPQTRCVRLAIVSANRHYAQAHAAAIAAQDVGGIPPHILVENHAGIIAALRDAPDLDAVLLVADRGMEEATLNLLSDLRSCGAAREAGLVLSLDAGQPSYAARAFDLGADNVVTHDAGPLELTTRINRLARLKHGRDALRRKVRDGLRMAVTDPLTGVYNRRFATEKLAQIANGPDEFALLMLDLDHFKQINDRHGHGVGDQVLSTIARALKANLRDSDLLARVGGEEFLIALPGATPNKPWALRNACAPLLTAPMSDPPLSGAVVKATLSIGVVHNRDAAPSIEALIAKADAALYRAKSDGRNMVSVSQAA